MGWGPRGRRQSGKEQAQLEAIVAFMRNQRDQGCHFSILFRQGYSDLYSMLVIPGAGTGILDTERSMIVLCHGIGTLVSEMVSLIVLAVETKLQVIASYRIQREREERGGGNKRGGEEGERGEKRDWCSCTVDWLQRLGIFIMWFKGCKNQKLCL